MGIFKIKRSTNACNILIPCLHPTKYIGKKKGKCDERYLSKRIHETGTEGSWSRP